jgi:glycosyltransferase involved in cell wall biosynthesis
MVGVEGDPVFDIERNRRSRRMWLQCIREADALVVTNPYLQKTFRRFKGWRLDDHPIGIVPNFIDFSLWRRFHIKDPSPRVRILWQGGWSHTEDLYMMRSALRRVALEHPEVVFVFFGYTNAELLKALPQEQVEVIHWTDSYNEYAFRMMTLDVDIGIAPLTGGDFDACKSPLKFLEYGALGIPSVLSDCAPYNQIVSMEPGKDDQWPAMLAKTEEDWVRLLGVLIDNPAARARMGDNAHRFVKTHFDLQSRARDIWEVYERILTDDFSGTLPGNCDVGGTGADLVVAAR